MSVATHSGTIPLFSLIMLAAVYGLQVIIFLLKRQWQFIGWLVIYLLAFPCVERMRIETLMGTQADPDFLSQCLRILLPHLLVLAL